MTERINVGDVVYVKRWPCCGALFGTFHGVDNIEPENTLGGRCGNCGEYHPPQGEIATFDSGRAAPLTWLRKVPPLSDDEVLDEIAEIVQEALG